MNIIKLASSDPRYPAEFTAVGSDKPAAIYALGNLDLLNRPKKVAIIGARRADRKGCEAAYRLGVRYAREGYVVVSGLALGCDAAAHRGCLDAGSETIAIVATGLDRTYPEENRSLQAAILRKGGLLLSEYPAGTPHTPQRLVARDRLQAALAGSVVVAQCPERSGTMHTVRAAEKYGKPVRTVAFAYRNEANAGNHLLLETGRAVADSHIQ